MESRGDNISKTLRAEAGAWNVVTEAIVASDPCVVQGGSFPTSLSGDSKSFAYKLMPTSSLLGSLSPVFPGLVCMIQHQAVSVDCVWRNHADSQLSSQPFTL